MNCPICNLISHNYDCNNCNISFYIIPTLQGTSKVILNSSLFYKYEVKIHFDINSKIFEMYKINEYFHNIYLEKVFKINNLNINSLNNYIINYFTL